MALAAASAASVVAVQTSPAEGATAPAENPTPIRLGDQLPAAERAMLKTEAAYWAILREWEKRWPLAPDALVMNYHNDRNTERGLRGLWSAPHARHAAARRRSAHRHGAFRRLACRTA